MTISWKPTKGQVALLEVASGQGDECLTGLVLDDAGTILIDLGASPRPADSQFPVTASFFTPEALYRVKGEAVYQGGTGLVELHAVDVERVQRRAAPRARVALTVELSTLDEPAFSAIHEAETVDVAPGGVRIRTTQPLPADLSEPAMAITLPTGESVVAIGQVLEEEPSDGRWQYRMSFAQISEPDAERLADLA